MAQLVFSRFFLTRQNSACRDRRAKGAAEVLSWFQQAPHSRGSTLFRLKARKGHRAYPGHPQVNVRSEWNWRASGRWARTSGTPPAPGHAAGLEGWPEHILEDSRPGNTLCPFHCFRPRAGKSEHQGCSALFFFSFLMEPLSAYCLKWAVALQAEQVVKKCQMQLYWLRIISQKYTFTLGLFK